MASDHQELHDVRVRVFKWNEQLHNVGWTQGLFMFRVTNSTNKEAHKPTENICNLMLFELACLQNRDTVRSLVSHAIGFGGIESFSEETTAKLRKSIFEQLLSFQFDIEMRFSMEIPIIVIVVDVHVPGSRENHTRKRILLSAFSSDRQEETEGSNDDVPASSESSGKKRKFGNAREYKKALKSLIERRKMSVLEEAGIRDTLRSRLEEPLASWIEPIVEEEPKGLRLVEPAMKVNEFDGREPLDACSICLDGILRGMLVAKTPCSHMFHSDCLFKWLPRTSCCPMCRSSCATLI